MLRLNNFSVSLDYTDKSLRDSVIHHISVPGDDLIALRVSKKSVDARDKGNVHFVLNLDLTVRNEARVLKRNPGLTPVSETADRAVPSFASSVRPLVVGAGPAGLFAALTLARSGACPLLIERGRCVDKRTNDVARMAAEGVLDPESNVQFGEGGAGAFSDGKLTCGIKSPYLRTVLETFVAHGAPDEILILQKPHIGTDKLKGVVASIRNEIIQLGGTVCFETRLERLLIRNGKIEGAVVVSNGSESEIRTDTVLLAIGHSARDTVTTLYDQGILMTQKPFAIGVRIEHPQAMINRSQYGRFASHPALGAADYKLACHTPDGRGVYTFCMCPGGEVIAAASEAGCVAVNGMSYHAREGVNANSALLTGIHTSDFGSDHPLAGIELQRRIEKAAYTAGGCSYRAPAQLVGDFLCDRQSSRFGDVIPTYKPGVELCDLRSVLPPFITADLKLGITAMNRQLSGFARNDAVLTAPETRSSSPVRIERNSTGESCTVTGLYPVGEGAGYAGGIVSAAVDGIRTAYMVLERKGEV